MTRAWIGVGLLAVSWLFGVGYFEPARLAIWAGLLLAASVLLGQTPQRRPDRRTSLLTFALWLPAVWLLPLPYKPIALFGAAGAWLCWSPLPGRFPQTLARGCVTASLVLLSQACVLWLYAAATARQHELPRFVAWPLNAALSQLGVDSALDQSTVVMRGVLEPLRVAATWELVFDPATVCFLVGGWVLLASWGCAGDAGKRCSPTPRYAAARPFVRNSLILAAIVLAWTPLRAVLLLAIVQQAALRADPLGLPNIGRWLINGWVHAGLLAVPVLLAARVLSRQRPFDFSAQSVSDTYDWNGERAAWNRASTAGLLLVAAGAAVLVCVWFWAPLGTPKPGRVMIVERHSTWEPTTEPYGTSVYGEAGSYNYAAAYDYCQQYFQMSRLLESDRLDRETLRSCDVLVIKTPTERYAPEEVEAIVEFVRAGGSLLLVGDHTNVFNMNTYLNDVARHFAFTFRHDLLFRVGDPYKQPYRPPRVAHPALQQVDAMYFAVSCSIDPGWSFGHMAMRSVGLWSLPSAYHESNYHPQAEYRTRMQYGAWCQLWAATHGRGRVLAFGDSTLFSNFCVFQPSKAELLVGMLHWLNHRSPLDQGSRRAWLGLIGLLLATGLAGAGCRLARSAPPATLAAAALIGWSAATASLTLAHRQGEPVALRPMPHVVIDRTLSEVPLFNGAFAEDAEGNGYGMLEQWIPRVGNYISRRSGLDAFCGDALVIICPTRSVPPDYLEGLVRFVEAGGRLVVLDSVEVQGTTANSLLWPFGLACSHATGPTTEGPLRCDFSAPPVSMLAACEIMGGEPLAWLHDVPVAARVRYGKGWVTAVGFAGLFNDGNMGFHWLPEPEADVLARYEVLYGLLRAALPNTSR